MGCLGEEDQVEEDMNENNCRMSSQDPGSWSIANTRFAGIHIFHCLGNTVVNTTAERNCLTSGWAMKVSTRLWFLNVHT